MSDLLRSLGSKFRGVGNVFIDVAFHASLAALYFRFWLDVFQHFRSGSLGEGDVFVAALLLLGNGFAYKRYGLPYGSALLGAMMAAYLTSLP